MLKRVIILLIVLLTILSCAKKSTEFKVEHILSLDAVIPTDGNPVDMDVSSSRLIVAEDEGGVSVINLSNYARKSYMNMPNSNTGTTQMSKIRKVSAVEDLNMIFLSGAGNTDKIWLVNSSNPDSLKLTQQASITGGTSDMSDVYFRKLASATDTTFYEGVYCVINDLSYGKVSAPIPTLPASWGVAFTKTPQGTPKGAYIYNDYIYAACDQLGLYIYSRIDGSLIGNVDLPGNALKIRVLGNYAYLACKQDGLQIVNISNPAAPVKIGSIDTSGYATNLDVWENHVVVASGGSGFYVFDVSNPAAPVLKDHITDAGYVNDVKYFNHKIMVASRDRGILIYSVED